MNENLLEQRDSNNKIGVEKGPNTTIAVYFCVHFTKQKNLQCTKLFFKHSNNNNNNGKQTNREKE